MVAHGMICIQNLPRLNIASECCVICRRSKYIYAKYDLKFLCAKPVIATEKMRIERSVVDLFN